MREITLLFANITTDRLISYPLVGDAGRAVGDDDRAAADEAQFRGDVLHDEVVVVRVDPDVAALPETPLEAGLGHPFPLARRGHAVDRGVGLVVGPGAVVYLQIGRVDPLNVAEGADYVARLVLADEAVPLLDLAGDQLLRRIAVDPLVAVAVRAHELAGTLVDTRQLGKVLLFGWSDIHGRWNFMIFPRSYKN